LNTQHIKKQKASDAELLYGTLSYESPEQMKEIGELGILFSLYFYSNILQIQWLNIFLETRSGFVEKEYDRATEDRTD